MVSPAHMMMALASREGLQLCVRGQEEGAQHAPGWWIGIEGEMSLVISTVCRLPEGGVVPPVIQVCVKAQEVHLFGQFYYGNGVRSGAIIYK